MGRFAALAPQDRSILVGRVVTMGRPNRVIAGGAVCIEGDRSAAVVDDPSNVPAGFSARAPSGSAVSAHQAKPLRQDVTREVFSPPCKQ